MMANEGDSRAMFENILRERGMLPDGKVMTNAVLVAAVEDLDGEMTTYCRIYPSGSQSHHITAGLLTICLHQLLEGEADDA